MEDKKIINERTRDHLYSLFAYIQKNPTERFWQAVRNWSGSDFILMAESTQGIEPLWFNIRDTFNDE